MEKGERSSRQKLVAARAKGKGAESVGNGKL